MKAVHLILIVIILLSFVGAVQANIADNNWSYNTILIHANQTPANPTYFNDSHLNHIGSTLGPTTTNLTSKKFGNASGWFSGATGSVYYPYAVDLDISLGNATIMFWINSTAVNTDKGIMTWSTPTKDGTFIYLKGTGEIAIGKVGVEAATTGAGISKNCWTQIVITKYHISTGNTTKIYVNGTLRMDSTTANLWLNPSNPFSLGLISNSGTDYYYQGHIDEIAIWKGVIIPISELWPQTEEIGGKFASTPSYTANATTSQVSPFAVQFNDTSTYDPNMINWSMDGAFYNFTDYPLTDARNISYSFTGVGTHWANLTVSNFTTFPGIVSTYSGKIFINDTLQADFNGTPRYGHPYTTVNFVDMSTGGGLYNWSWSFGFLGNVSYIRNPYYQYNQTGNYWVNQTVKGADGQSIVNRSDYIRINWNNTFTLQIRDSASYNLITDNVHVTLSQLGVGYTAGNTTTGIISFELPDGLYDVMAQSPTNYNGNIASVTMTGTDASGIIYLTKTTSQSLYLSNWYSPHTVRIAAVDTYGNRLTGVTVNCSAIANTFPPGSTSEWVQSMYGINPMAANDLLNGTLIMSGVTAGDGTATFTMLASIGYLVSLSGSFTPSPYTTTIYPVDIQYTVYLPGATQVNTHTYTSNVSLTYSTPNASFYTLGLDYYDDTGTTTDLYFRVVAQNGTVLTDDLYPAVGYTHILVNVTLPNVRGDGQVWSYAARHS